MFGRGPRSAREIPVVPCCKFPLPTMCARESHGPFTGPAPRTATLFALYIGVITSAGKRPRPQHKITSPEHNIIELMFARPAIHSHAGKPPAPDEKSDNPRRKVTFKAKGTAQSRQHTCRPQLNTARCPPRHVPAKEKQIPDPATHHPNLPNQRTKPSSTRIITKHPTRAPDHLYPHPEPPVTAQPQHKLQP